MQTRKDIIALGLFVAVLASSLPMGNFPFPTEGLLEAPVAEAYGKTKTTAWFVGSTISTTAGASAVTSSYAFTISLPDLLPVSGSIRSAYILYNTHWNNTTAISTSTFTLTTQGGTPQDLPGITNLNSSGENVQLAFRLDATAALRNLIGTASGTYAMTFTVRMTGPTRMSESAQLFVTYDYDPFAPVQVNTTYKHVYSTSTQLGTTVITSPAFNFALPESGATSTFRVGASSTNHFWIEYRGRFSNANISTDLGWDAETTSSATFTQSADQLNFLLVMQPKTAGASPNSNHTVKMKASAATSISGYSAIAITTYSFNFAASTKLRKTLPILLMQSSLTGSAATINATTTINIPEGSPSSTDAFLYGRTVFTTAANPGINATTSPSGSCTFPSTTAITMPALSGEVTGYPTVIWDVGRTVRFNASGDITICSSFTSSASANIRGLMLYLSYDYTKSTAGGARGNNVLRMLGPANETPSNNIGTSSIDTTVAAGSSSLIYSWLNADYNDNGQNGTIAAQTLTLSLGGSSVAYAFVNTGENTHGEVFSATSSEGMNSATTMGVDPSLTAVSDATFNMFYQAEFLPTVLTQEHYHWRNNNGGEATSTEAASEDTSTTTVKNTVYRLRFGISNEGDASSTPQFRLEYQQSTTTGAWTQLATSTVGSAHWQMATSSFVLNGNASTTNISTATGGLTDENVFFKAGFLMATTTTNTAPGITLTGLEETEVEYALKATTNADSGATYYFRVTNAGAALDVYDIYASTTIAVNSPSVSAVSLNNANDIILTPNSTTTIRVNFTVTDQDGCSDVFTGGSVTTRVYRTGVTSSCPADPRNCYITTAVASNSCSSGSTGNATATLDIYYYADATDASSSYAAESWQASVTAVDSFAAQGENTSALEELSTLVAIDIPTATLDYGTVIAGATSTGDKAVTIKNAGNASTTIQIAGTALTLGVNSIATSSQHYATSTFNYGGFEQALSAAATAVSGLLLNVSGTGVSTAGVGNWAATTPLASALQQFGALAYNGFLYVLGGFTSGATAVTSTVRFAAINPAGSVGSWTNTTPLPVAVGSQRGLAKDGFIYSVAGSIGASQTSTIEFAAINATGSIGSWSDTTPLPNTLVGHGALIHNQHMYVFGGLAPGAVTTATVRSALINSTGSIGAWTNTTALPSAMRSQGTALYNNFVYSIGGTTGAARSSSVNFASVSSGTVGAWTPTTPIPVALDDVNATAIDGYLYAFGGSNGNPTSTVMYAPINATGSIGSWTTTSGMLSGLADFGFADYGGYAYAYGGVVSGATETSTVGFAKIPVTAQSATANIYWGVQVNSAPVGTFSGVTTYTAVFSP